MAIQNKLYESTASLQSIKPRKSYQREELLTRQIAEDLNTYKNFGIFHTRADVIIPKVGEDGNWIPGQYKGAARAGALGVRSIFNAYAATLTGDSHERPQVNTLDKQRTAWAELVGRMSDFRHSNNTPLMDTPETRRLLRQHNDISVKGLVEASKHGAFSRTPYAYSDFMYCKYLNRVPNNYLITLRRFANPVMDNIKPVGRGRKKAKYNTDGISHPIGTMVTWLGVSGNDMKEILKYSYSMSFIEKQAKWDEIKQEGGQGVLSSLEAALNPATRGLWGKGYGNQPLDEFIPGMFGLKGGGPYTYPPPFSTPGSDQNKVWGPVDRVKKNYQRGEEGLNWDMSFTLTFDYELRAYNGINPRQAMLDLLANILSVTYITGGFWAGGYYAGGMTQSSTFRNLSIFKATGGFTNYMDALVHDVATLGQQAQNTIKANGGFWETMKAIANAVGGMLMGALVNHLGRPAKYYAPALLSEAPVGMWHITIGNPYRPIVSMGNMILKRTTITHSGPLGLDDFPTNLTVSCEFDRGKPRDQYGTEAIYMAGNDRIYHGMSSKIFDMYKAAEVYKGGKGDSWSLDEDKSDMEQPKPVVPKEEDKSVKTTTNDSNKSQTPPSDDQTVGSDPMTPGEETQQTIDIPGQSIEELKAMKKENLAEVERITGLAGNMNAGSVLQEVFGDPDAYVIYITAREMQEGSSKNNNKENASEANAEVSSPVPIN